MLLNFIFLIVYTLLSSFLSGEDLYYLSSIHIIIYIFHSLTIKKNISPIILFALGSLIVNIGNIALISQLYTRTIITYNYIVPKYIDNAAQIWCISFTLIIIGFDSTIKKSLPPISFDIKKNHLRNIFIALFISNIIILFNHYANILHSLKIFGMINTMGIVFYARLWAKEDNKTYRNYAIILLVIETYLSLTTSFLRFELILPTFCMFMGYFLGKGDIKYLFSYRVLPYLLLIIIYASIFRALQINRSDTNFISVFYDSGDNYVQNNVKDNKQQYALLIRSANVAQLTNVVRLVNQNGLYYGKASAPLVMALIPRMLWPDKPLIRLGAWFALEIGQAYQNETGYINNSINMTVMGELYLDFGWIGVIIGSLLLGVFIALLWNSTEFYLSPYNLMGTVFGGYLFMILFIGIAADLQIVITFLSFYVTFYIIKKVATYLMRQ